MVKKGNVRKFGPKHIGPYKIIKKMWGPITYQLEDPTTKTKRYATIYRMVPYTNPKKYINISSLEEFKQNKREKKPQRLTISIDSSHPSSND